MHMGRKGKEQKERGTLLGIPRRFWPREESVKRSSD
jgi:hypothetical protein